MTKYLYSRKQWLKKYPGVISHLSYKSDQEKVRKDLLAKKSTANYKPKHEEYDKKDECICIMSGFAQTTNYCPVHKHQDITKTQKAIT